MNALHSPYAKLVSIITLTLSFLNIHSVEAFQPPSALLVSSCATRNGFSIALQKKNDEPTTAPANVRSTPTDWIREEFESLTQTHLPTPHLGESKTGKVTSSEGLLSKGRVVGPDRVLVYDTTLRGEQYCKR